MSTKHKFRVAIDAMGGDHAPKIPVEGAVLAAQNSDASVFLVGDPDQVEAELEKHNTNNIDLTLVPSEGYIDDAEAPTAAFRKKPKASILIATELVKRNITDAVVSMGSTGGSMAAAVVILGTIDGIDRPAIGGPIVGSAPKQTILDLGSNIDCRASQLLGFGVLGSVFCNLLLGVDNPRIGVLSIGSEEGKGNALSKETTELFKKSGLHFIGNIEGHDLVVGKADVVVCDGFVGNIVLKLVEGLGQGLAKKLESILADKIPSRQIAELIQGFYRENNVVDSRGGGPIFGVNGVSIIGHGSSSSETIERAVGLARMCVETKLIEEMNNQVPLVMSKVK